MHLTLSGTQDIFQEMGNYNLLNLVLLLVISTKPRRSCAEVFETLQIFFINWALPIPRKRPQAHRHTHKNSEREWRRENPTKEASERKRETEG